MLALAVAALTLAQICTAGIDPRHAENLTVFHVNPLRAGDSALLAPC